MLIDQQDRNILPLRRELLKGAFDRRRFRLAVDDEVVLLRVGRFRDVLRRDISFGFLIVVCGREGAMNVRRRQLVGCP